MGRGVPGPGGVRPSQGQVLLSPPAPRHAVPGPSRARPPAVSRERLPSEPGVRLWAQPMTSLPDSVGKRAAAFAGECLGKSSRTGTAGAER